LISSGKQFKLQQLLFGNNSGRVAIMRLFIEGSLLAALGIMLLEQWNVFAQLQDSMFNAVDAQQYKAYGEYLLDIGGYASSTRPYLYPLLVAGLYKLGGIQLLWCFQFVLHVTGGMLLFATNRSTFRSVILWFGIVMLYGIHPTLLVQTAHALTESIITFLMCVLVYVQFSKSPAKILHSILIIGMASVIKPLFLYLYVGILAALFYRALKTKSRRLIFKIPVIASIIIVITQPMLMKIQQGSFFFSKIGSITIHDYYLQLLYARVEGISFPLQSGPKEKDTQQIATATATWTTRDILSYAAQNPANAVFTGVETIFTNLDSGSQLLPGNKETLPMLHGWVKATRKLSVGFHLLAVLGIIILAFKKSLIHLMAEHAILLLTLLYIIVTSGISFWQGDRLVIIALPIWMIVYARVFKLVVRMLRGKLHEVQHR
jgi:hypothetical protein